MKTLTLNTPALRNALAGKSLPNVAAQIGFSTTRLRRMADGRTRSIGSLEIVRLAAALGVDPSSLKQW